jgi:hypothetical protein
MKDEYLEKKITAAAPQLAKITDPEAWLAEVRGYEPPRQERITIEPPRPDHPGQFLPGVTWQGEPVEDLNQLIKTIKKQMQKQEKFKKALHLLRSLADVQNDAPLEKYREEWKRTMREVYDFLHEHECRDCGGAGFEQDKTGILKPCENCSE